MKRKEDESTIIEPSLIYQGNQCRHKAIGMQSKTSESGASSLLLLHMYCFCIICFTQTRHNFFHTILLKGWKDISEANDIRVTKLICKKKLKFIDKILLYFLCQVKRNFNFYVRLKGNFPPIGLFPELKFKRKPQISIQQLFIYKIIIILLFYLLLFAFQFLYIPIFCVPKKKKKTLQFSYYSPFILFHKISIPLLLTI